MTHVFVVIEHDNQQPAPANLGVLQAASQLSDRVTCLVAGQDSGAVAEQVAGWPYVTAVLYSDAEHYAVAMAEQYAPLIAAAVTQLGDVTHIAMAATTTGKNMLPRAAALTDATMLSDVVAIKDNKTFVRPTYAGNVLSTQQVNAGPVIALTVRPTAFSMSAGTARSTDPAAITTLASAPVYANATHVSLEQPQNERPALGDAKTVLSGGRGLQDETQFKRLEELALHMQAAVGASRAAVDAGLAPNDYQVGQTGQVVAPDLYMAWGISGAIQHIAGMADSRVVVAVNKDEAAPIFNVSNYGLVADAKAVIEEFEQELQRRGLLANKHSE